MRTRSVAVMFGALVAVAACALAVQVQTDTPQPSTTLAMSAPDTVVAAFDHVVLTAFNYTDSIAVRAADIATPAQDLARAPFELMALGTIIGSTATVRAKVRCHSKTPSTGPGSSTSLSFGAVYSDDPSSENKSFADATPSLSLSMSISDGKPAADQFEQGKDYYLDFTPAE